MDEFDKQIRALRLKALRLRAAGTAMLLLFLCCAWTIIF